MPFTLAPIDEPAGRAVAGLLAFAGLMYLVGWVGWLCHTDPAVVATRTVAGHAVRAVFGLGGLLVAVMEAAALVLYYTR